jgi:hypothetical protein
MADTTGVDETNDLGEKPEELEEGPLCCEGPMSADELIYWLQWYREVATLQRAAAGCVRLGGSTGTELIEDGLAPYFGDAVLRLDALHGALYAARGNDDDTRESVWPASSLPEDTQEALRALVRQPCEIPSTRSFPAPNPASRELPRPMRSVLWWT